MSEEPDRLHSIGSQSRTQLKWLNMRAYILPSPQYFLSPDICQLQYTDEQLLASRLVSKLYDGNTLIGYVFLAFETPLPTSIPSTGQVFLRRLLLNKAVGESHSRKSIVSFHSSPYFQDSSLFQCLSHIYQWKFHPPKSSRDESFTPNVTLQNYFPLFYEDLMSLSLTVLSMTQREEASTSLNVTVFLIKLFFFFLAAPSLSWGTQGLSSTCVIFFFLSYGMQDL